MARERPNFLFFVTDQQHADHVGYAGNNVIRTPHMDALATGGSWFDQFIVSSPLCMPNRATFMTGRMPSLHGVRHNGIPLDLDEVTFVDVLAAAGYRTALIGKSHLQNNTLEAPPNPKPLYEGLEPPPLALSEARRSTHSETAYHLEAKELWRDDPDRLRDPPETFYGFQHLDFVTGHGDVATGHYERWLRDRFPELAHKRGAEHALATGQTGAEQTYQTALSEDAYPTSYIRERTVEWLERYAESPDDPFFLQCSFPDPHHPFCPPGRYWDMYDPAEIELPESFFRSDGSQVPPLKRIHDSFERGEGPRTWVQPFMVTEKQAREIMAKTYGMISMIDDAVGAVVETLGRLELDNDTIICMMSDHGDWMADHRLFLKGYFHFRSILRTPFVWRDVDPSYNRGRISGLASTLDLPGTILRRARLAPFHGIQSVDLTPLLRGTSEAVRDSVLVEQTTNWGFLDVGGETTITTLINEDWRLTVWEDADWGELYDLRADPCELHNLWEDSALASTKSALLWQLVRVMQQHGDRAPYPMGFA